MRKFCKNRVLSPIATFAVAVAAMLFNLSAQAQVTLPDTGVDVGGYITALITGLGAVVAIAVGGFAAFMLIRAGLRWMGWAK